MGLKQLMLARKIEQRKSSLSELFEAERDFTTRSETLESAIEEAGTEEEIEAIEEEVEKLESEKVELDEKKVKLEEQIEELESELEELNNKAPTNKDNNRNTFKSGNQRTEGGNQLMIRAKFFKGMTRDFATDFVKREEVSDFLGRVKEEVRSKRAVQGADLNIPDVVLELLKDNLHRYSKLISKVNLRSVPGTSRQNIVGEIPEAIWTEACATLNELDLKFSQVEIDGYKVGGYIPVCNATLEDTAINLASEILDALGQAIGYSVDKAIVYGTGSKMPLGIVTRLAQSSKPSDWSANAPDWKNLSVSNVLKIEPQDTAQKFFAEIMVKSTVAKANYAAGTKFFAMNETTKIKLLAETITFNAAGALIAGQNNTMPIIGGEIIELDFIPDGDIVFGYGGLYLLGERSGSKFATSEHVRFIQDQTVFKGTARYDGMPVLGQGFGVMNINNAAPTMSVVFAPDKASEVVDPEGA